ncbi:histamine N-methyltransferase-like [Diadema antillarum]|uniref:histamine N-methyltransferase-like n=1 Tax=Diadema antillarum TaxID=105358 RepID=UPI003A85B1BC
MELTSLLENEARYKDVYLTGFSRIAQKDAIYHHVTYHFEKTVLGNLKKVFAHDEQFNVMGVGVGEGKHEIAVMKNLRPFYNKISSIAIEPNAKLLQTYEENMQRAEVIPPVDVKFFNEHSPFPKLWKAVPSLNRQDVNITLTGEDVTREAERRGCDVTKIPLQLTLDVTELFDEASDFGNKILDFFTMTSYFRQTAPKALVEEVVEFWRDSITRDESGRCRADFEEYLLIVQKCSPP